MNVKNKVISVVMSFIIIFGTVSSSFANDKEHINNIQPLVVDAGIISAPMLATVAGLAVGTGIVLKNNDDIYDIGRIFYEYIESQNDLTWDFVTNAFNVGHVLINDVVNVKSGEFLDIVKGFFSSAFPSDDKDTSVGFVPGFGYPTLYSFADEEIKRGSYKILNTAKGNVTVYKLNSNGSYVKIFGISSSTDHYKGFMIGLNSKGESSFILVDKYDRQYVYTFSTLVDTISIPYSGTYNPGILEEKKNEDGSISLPIPGNLGNLVGQGSTDFWENTDGLVGVGSISLPVVDSPSIGVTNDVFVGSPSVDVPGDIPGDTPGDTPGIVFPPFGGGLDFTPITQSSFVDKFPFSLAKDIKNIVSVFDVEPKAPKFTVPIVSEELEIDLTQFNVWASIIRFFVLIGFIVALINITRKVIG